MELEAFLQESQANRMTNNGSDVKGGCMGLYGDVWDYSNIQYLFIYLKDGHWIGTRGFLFGNDNTFTKTDDVSMYPGTWKTTRSPSFQ